MRYMLLVFFFWSDSVYIISMRLLTGRTFNPLPSFLVSIVLPVIIGLYLALPEFYHMLKKSGNLVINWIRIIFVGIPTFFINISVLLFFFSPLGHNQIFQWIYQGFDLLGFMIIGIAFGYNFLLSFNKAKENNIIKEINE